LTVHQLSFEGPDGYSSAGGLGVRVTGLANALAATGVATDLYFVGDPDLPAIELRNRVTLRRWCQHISRHARAGVYDAGEDKIADLCTWWPAHVADRVHADAAAGIHTIVLAEDWHTVWPLIGLHHELERRGLRSAATLAWTANNRFGFDRIDFGQLAQAATILTISRAMKHLMWNSGVNPLVVPNGIPDDVFTPIDDVTQQMWAESFADRTTLAKVGRWDPDKRWHMAIGTVATLRNRGERAILLARGWDGNAAAATHYAELRQHAAAIGLEWTTCDGPVRSGDELAHALSASLPPQSGIVELTQSIAGATLQSFYAGTSAVLANSGFEPFGLVGLEAMAAGALVITGATGEDYVESYVNGFALDTDAPQEIVRAIDWTRRQPHRTASIRSAAIATADRYRWPQMVERIWLALDLPAVTR
ncbi:MAG TPA: glycosyltransferase family 4 protein, partial [Ilumatobacteraceae bacterium]|nr:glycosyltransferase family 4 protein [Ilumatobacteraceae bacterium]